MPVKRRKQRPRINSKGKMVLQLSVLTVGGGIYWSDAVLAMIGVFLLILVLFCFVLCWNNFSKIEWQREMPDSVFAGREFHVYLSAKLAKGFSAYCLSVKDYFLPEKKSNFLLPVVGESWQKVAAIKMKISKRGVYEDAVFKLTSDFPLGFFKMEKKYTASSIITVFPEPYTPAEGFQLMHGQENEVERDFCSGRYSYGSFRGLREFTPGDPLKLVSWSVSARSEQLMVRDLEPPEPERYTVIFHSVKIKNIMPDSKQFERCLRILSGLFIFLQENNISFEFYTSMNDWNAYICDNPSEPPIEALTSLAKAKFGGADSLTELNSTLQKVPADYHCIVLGASSLDAWEEKIGKLSGSMTLMDAKSIRHKNQVFA